MLDHRAISRLNCRIEVIILTPGGWQEGQVTDVGLGGVRLHSPVALEEASVVEVAPKARESLDPVYFQVRWCRPLAQAGYLVGLAFRQPIGQFADSWMANVLAREGLSHSQILQRRKNLRVQMDLGCRLGRPRGQRRPGTLLDLSLGGAAVRSRHRWKSGEGLRLSLFHGEQQLLELPALVVARRKQEEGWHYGLAFEPLTDSERAALQALLVRRIRQAGRELIRVESP